MSVFTAHQPSGDTPAGVVPSSQPDPDLTSLSHKVTLGAGVTAELNVLKPQSVQITVTDFSIESLSLLKQLVKPAALTALKSGLAAGAKDFELIHQAKPWHRLVTVEALARWVQLHVDQDLIDVEIAVARWRVAKTLPAGEFRTQLIKDALERPAARVGLSSYVQRLTAEAVAPPLHLQHAIEDVVDGLIELGRGQDLLDLTSLSMEWQSARMKWRKGPARLSGTQELHVVLGDADNPDDGGASPDEQRSVADPRLLPARAVALALDSTVGDIILRPTTLGATAAVEVEIEAYDSDPERAAKRADDMLVRLIDRRTGEVVGPSLLDLNLGGGIDDRKRFVFRGILPLHGRELAQLRADVFDVDIEDPPVRRDDDRGLIEVRRQMSVLRKIRAIAAIAWLDGGSPQLNERLRSVTGDPNATLLTLPVSGRRSPDPARYEMTTGAGQPLLAELAAVYDIGQ